MTIICPTCQAVIAERCPHCGRKAEVLGRLSDGRPALGAVRGGFETPPQWLKEVCWCDRCKKFFERGQGGEKKELCAKCAPKQTEMQLNVAGLKVEG